MIDTTVLVMTDYRFGDDSTVLVLTDSTVLVMTSQYRFGSDRQCHFGGNKTVLVW
jgi:hypothetical protein